MPESPGFFGLQRARFLKQFDKFIRLLYEIVQNRF
jgi:hypothetical protein